MNKVKVGVIGTCVSRDAFNSKFIKNYREFYQCVLTQNHMSIISLISDPIPYVPKVLDGDINDFNKQIFMNELTKGVWDSLKLQNPDYLILDFISDAYFGIRKVGSSMITDKSFLFKKTSLFSTLNLKDQLNLEDNYEEYIALWKNAFDIFMDKMKNDFPNIKVIVNKVYFTEFYIPNNHPGKLKKICDTGMHKKINVEHLNRGLDRLYEYAQNSYELAFLEYNKEYYSEECHIWELHYAHYTKDFYEDFTTKLISTILEDLNQVKQKQLKTNSHPKPNDNLIRNSTFNLGNSFWSFWQEDFKVMKPEEDCPTSNFLEIDTKGYEEDTYRQVWSNAVEINSRGNQFFTVSFDIKINNVSDIDGLKFVFSIRTFNQIDKVFQGDSVWYKNLKVQDIQNLKDGEWVRCSYTFKPARGIFIKVGPYLIKNGNISWRNIKLEKGDQVTEWIPAYKEK